MMGMPSCRKVSAQISSGAPDDAPLRRRLGLRAHLLLCRHCRRYARQIRAIGRAAQKVFAHPRGESESLERLRRTLLDHEEGPRKK